MERIQALRGGRPLVIVDLAVPCDFFPEIGKIAGIHLFNIDDLNQVISENVRQPHEEIPAAETIVGLAVETFHGQMTYREVEPVIRHLIDRFEQIRLGEMQKFVSRFPHESHEALEALTRSLIKKLLHFPISKLKSLRDGGDLSAAEAAFLRRAFLHEPASDESRDAPTQVAE